jgi:hypothetical protein
MQSFGGRLVTGHDNNDLIYTHRTFENDFDDMTKFETTTTDWMWSECCKY